MVNNCSGCHSALLMAHNAQRMQAEKSKPFTIPFAAIYSWFLLHASLHALRRSVLGAESG